MSGGPTVTFGRVEKALEFLTDSAQQLAEARGRRMWLEHRLKIVRAEVLLANEGSVAEREARAYVSDTYRSATDEMQEAVVTEEKLRALRVAAEALVEVWRSLESSRRAANV